MMARNKTAIAVVIGIIIVAAIAVIYHLRVVNDMKEKYEGMISSEKAEKLQAIDSVMSQVSDYRDQIEIIQTEKELYVENFKVLQRRIQEYSKPRYYPDATFLSESQRIANSRYRHNAANDSTGQGENH